VELISLIFSADGRQVTLLNLGVACNDLGEPKQGQKYLERALEIIYTNAGQHHPMMAVRTTDVGFRRFCYVFPHSWA
jgi:hypothetical protein